MLWKSMKLFVPLLLALTLSATAIERRRKQDHKNLRYLNTPGVDKKYQTLDWYQPSRKSMKRGVIVYVHGGGWQGGDKSNQMKDKVSYFRDKLGYNFVSVNYRLMVKDCTKRTGFVKKSTVPCKFPDNANDVAAAIAYVTKNAWRYGASGKSVSLIGHSAGAHLAALVSTDETYLSNFGLALSNINFVAPLDTDAFQISTRVGDMQAIANTFGHSRQLWWDASPINYVKKDQLSGTQCLIPPHLIVFRGQEERRKHILEYSIKLIRAGCTAKTFYALKYSHSQINAAIGKQGEKVVTPQIVSMLKKYNNW